MHRKSEEETTLEGRTLRLQVAMAGALALGSISSPGGPLPEPTDGLAAAAPRAALFDGESVRGRPMARGWLFVGLYVLAGLVFGAACAYLAVARALPAAPWFFAGLAGNVVALAALLTRPAGDRTALPEGIPPGLAKVATTREPRACPACGAANHPSASACEACGAELHPTVRPETATAN